MIRAIASRALNGALEYLFEKQHSFATVWTLCAAIFAHFADLREWSIFFAVLIFVAIVITEWRAETKRRNG